MNNYVEILSKHTGTSINNVRMVIDLVNKNKVMHSEDWMQLSGFGIPILSALSYYFDIENIGIISKIQNGLVSNIDMENCLKITALKISLQSS